MTEEQFFRMITFFGIFSILVVWEIIFPRTPLKFGRWRRWVTNLGIFAVNSLVIRLVFLGAAVGVSVWAEIEGIGLFNNLALPGWAAEITCFFALDFAIWAAHILFHKIPFLWRLHRAHHGDPDIDVTTALRFHPLEILLSMSYKCAIILVLGAPPLAVLIFEIVLNGAAMFNHGNVHLPAKLDRLLRLIIVTPDMHRIHHSTLMDEQHNNYGFSISTWDRLFGTYNAAPKEPVETMPIGLKEWQNTAPTGFVWTLFGTLLNRNPQDRHSQN